VLFHKNDVTAKCYVSLYKDYKCNNILYIYIYIFFLNLVSKLPEDGSVVSKYAGVIKVSKVAYAVCVFGWYGKKNRSLKCMNMQFHKLLPSKITSGHPLNVQHFNWKFG